MGRLSGRSKMFPNQNADSQDKFPGEQSSLAQGGDNSHLTSPRSQHATDEKMVKFMRGVRFITALAGIGLVVGMVFSIMGNIVSFNVTALIICVYLTPIGCIIFIAEWEKLFYKPVVAQFPFLKHHLGRSIFYMFVAGQLLAVAGITGYILGIFFAAVSIIGIVHHCSLKPSSDQVELNEVSTVSDTPQPSLQHQSQQPAYVDSVDSNPFGASEQRAEPGSKSLYGDSGGADASFGAQIGAELGGAAVDWAQRNPEQAQQAPTMPSRRRRTTQRWPRKWPTAPSQRCER